MATDQRARARYVSMTRVRTAPADNPVTVLTSSGVRPQQQRNTTTHRLSTGSVASSVCTSTGCPAWPRGDCFSTS